jgi:predicted transcriptional regulator
MKNVTLSAPDDLLDRARRRAESESTTVNALFRQWLAQYVGEKTLNRADVERILASVSHFRAGRRFTREERNER